MRSRKEKTTAIHQPHDTSYKFLLSSKRIFVELLRLFVRRGWTTIVDEDQLEQIPHSFILPDFKHKEADLVYRIHLNGREIIFYILMEFQSSVDYRMPYRLLLYQVEIWRYLLENRPEGMANRKSFQLPPIVPIVLYNGKAKWTAKRQFRQLLSHEDRFGSELLNFEYILIDVARYTEKDLLTVASTIGAVFFLDQAEDQAQLIERLHKLLHVMQQLPIENQQKLMTWMKNMLRENLPEHKQEPILHNWLESMEGDEQVMGLSKVLGHIIQKERQEGLQEGLQKGKELVTKEMINTGADNAYISKVTGISIEKIEQLREQMKLKEKK